MIDRPNKIHQLTLSKKTRIGLLRKSLLSVDSISPVSPFATETPFSRVVHSLWRMRTLCVPNKLVDYGSVGDRSVAVEAFHSF